MREGWREAVRVRSLLQVFVLQGLCMLPVVSPVLVLAAGEPMDIGVFQAIAAAVFAS